MAGPFDSLKQSQGVHIAQVAIRGAIRAAILGAVVAGALFGVAALGSSLLGIGFLAGLGIKSTSVFAVGLAVAYAGATVGSLIGLFSGAKSAVNEYNDIKLGVVDATRSAHLQHLERGIARKEAKKKLRETPPPTTESWSREDDMAYNELAKGAEEGGARGVEDHKSGRSTNNNNSKTEAPHPAPGFHHHEYHHDDHYVGESGAPYDAHGHAERTSRAHARDYHRTDDSRRDGWRDREMPRSQYNGNQYGGARRQPRRQWVDDQSYGKGRHYSNPPGRGQSQPGQFQDRRNAADPRNDYRQSVRRSGSSSPEPSNQWNR